MKRFYHVMQLAVPGVLVLVLAAQAHASAQVPTNSQFSRQAEALIKDYGQDELFTGAVLVARHGKPIFRQSYGAANREWMIPNSVNTRYRIGSITKQFTAAAILQLADENKLGIDDPISKYLPKLPQTWQQATIRQLLSHTSGIPSHTMQEDAHTKLLPVRHTPQELIDLLKDVPLSYEHGKEFQYNNMGYVLLGSIIATVSGMPYPDYLEQKLLKPLNMRHSGYDDGRVLVKQLAQDYKHGMNDVVKSRFVDMSNTSAAGAMYSTVDDLLTWQQMLIKGKVLSPASLKAMFTDGGHHYGLGWYVRQHLSRPLHEHGGNLGGYSSLLAYYPDDQLTVIILSNYGDEVVERVGDALARLALGLPPVHRKIKVDTSIYARFVGRYEVGSKIYTVTAKDQRLFGQLDGQQKLEIVPESSHRYFYKSIDVVVTFDEDASGKIASVTLHQNGDKTKARRLD